MDFTLFKPVEHEQVIADLREEFSQGPVEIEGEWQVVLPEEELELVAQSLHGYKFDIGFGDHQRVLVAVGGVAEVENGVAKARRFFATLWYTADGKLISTDLTREAP